MTVNAGKKAGGVKVETVESMVEVESRNNRLNQILDQKSGIQLPEDVHMGGGNWFCGFSIRITFVAGRYQGSISGKPKIEQGDNLEFH